MSQQPEKIKNMDPSRERQLNRGNFSCQELASAEDWFWVCIEDEEGKTGDDWMLQSTQSIATVCTAGGGGDFLGSPVSVSWGLNHLPGPEDLQPLTEEEAAAARIRKWVSGDSPWSSAEVAPWSTAEVNRWTTYGELLRVMAERFPVLPKDGEITTTLSTVLPSTTSSLIEPVEVGMKHREGGSGQPGVSHAPGFGLLTAFLHTSVWNRINLAFG